MAHQTPTHERPEFPDDDLLPEQPAPTGRQLLRMFVPVAVAIVIFIGAFTLALKFLVIPAMEQGDPNVQVRALATIGALQTREAVTRSRQAPTAQTAQPASTPQATPTAQPVIRATTAPTAVRAAATQAPTPAPQPTPSSAAAGNSDVTAPQGAVDTGDGPAQIDTSAGVIAIPTVDITAQAEVQEAYARYWTQRSLAFRDLDPSLLTDVAAGPELSGLTSEIETLRSQQRAIKTHVIHHALALPTAPGEAVVADEYEDLSTFIDFVTKEPIDPDAADPQSGPVVKVREVLQKIDGLWKVTGGRTYE